MSNSTVARVSNVSSSGETAVSDPEAAETSKETVEPSATPAAEENGTGDKAPTTPEPQARKKSSRLSKLGSAKIPAKLEEEEPTKAKSGGSVGQQKLVGFQDEKVSVAAAANDANLKGTILDYFATTSTPARKSATNTVTHGAGKPLRRPKLIYDNTYQLEPHFPFSSTRVETGIKMVLEEMFCNFSYSPEGSSKKAVQIAEKIRRHVLSLHFSRYRVCVLVTISPIDRQGFHNAFRCLWDVARDSYAYASCRSKTAFCVASVWGLYFE